MSQMQAQRVAEAEVRTPAELPMEMREPRVRWSLPGRIGFRFLFSYLVLFLLTGQEIASIPFSGSLVEKYTRLWHTIAVWIGQRIFDIRYEIVLDGSGSGDTTFRWILLPCYVVLAAAATAVWSAIDRRRANYERVNQWLRLMLRFSLGFAMIHYGIAKVIPSQMPAPYPFTLTQRVGELTPMRLLWTFMGASPAYETFTGLAELLGGILLLAPRTTLLGSLICAADMTMVVMLNLCYDVPVKIMSFHYLVMAVLLIAPDLRRLGDLFLFNRTVEPARVPPPLLARPGLDRGVQILFFLFGLFVIGASIDQTRGWYAERNPPRPPMYGVWSVEELVIDGKDVPMFKDPDRWRWVTFQRPGALSIELMIGSGRGYAIAVRPERKAMTLWPYRRDAEGNMVRDAAGMPQRALGPAVGELFFAAPEPDALVLNGRLEGRRTHAKLRKMTLLGSNFHWILDPPKE